MNPILSLLLGRLSERLVVALLLQILEQIRPLVANTNTQLDDVVLDALIAALRREEQEVSNARSRNGGAL